MNLKDENKVIGPGKPNEVSKPQAQSNANKESKELMAGP